MSYDPRPGVGYMMALGDYRFSVNEAAYQTLVHSSEYRWKSQERVGRLPAQQYVGPGTETVSLEGVIYPHYAGGIGQLDAMRLEANKGEPLMLVDGRGNVWQKWVITSIEETQSILFEDGTPRKVEFSLQLSRYGEDG
uniref:Phage tail protein n=1 Tax=Candidatus Kentrum sp. LFY TaxID=2126342 RepID=A0A450W6T5_9GAMM|nr:MAG: hypothetical protein BECKLFY1418C_GA0070996_100167 [Candidatus Kentron sp. LFY]